MNITKDQHLNDDQIIGAIVEAGDLPDTVRKHLAGCSQCRMAVEKFEEELSTLGKIAISMRQKLIGSFFQPVV